MLKLLEDYEVDSTLLPIPDPRGPDAYALSNPHPVKRPRPGMKQFVLMDGDQPVADAMLYLNKYGRPPNAMVKAIHTDGRYFRKGYSTRMTELLHKWAAANGWNTIRSDFDLSPERRAFWRKQVAKGRAKVVGAAETDGDGFYELTVPPGTNLDGIWQPWSPPWGRR